MSGETPAAGTRRSADPAPARSRRTALHRLAVVVLVLVTVVVATVAARSSWGQQDRYAVDCLAVGAHVDDERQGASPAGLATFHAVSDLMGPLTIRRSFDPRLPSSFAASAAAEDAGGGVRSFVSWKPPDGDFAGAARGDYDDQVVAWARSVPRAGVYATAFHEPENDMTAEQFVAMQRHLYSVVKAANPTIKWGPVYMAYWWDPGKPDHYVGNPAAWWPGDRYADFAGLDWYGADPKPMTRSDNFRHWYRTMRSTGKPLLITEYGQYAVRPGERPDPALQQRRAEAIRADAAWIRGHPRIRMWMYWHDFGPRGDWRLTDEASQEAWRDVAAAGCR